MGPARHRWLAGGRGALSERGGGPREGPSGRSNVSSPPLFERPTKPPPLRPPTATARGATDAAAVAAALTAPTVDSAPAGVVGAAGFGAMPSIGRVRSSAIPPGHSPHGVRHGLGSGGGRGRRRRARGGGGPPGMGGAPPAPSLAPAATLKRVRAVHRAAEPPRRPERPPSGGRRATTLQELVARAVDRVKGAMRTLNLEFWNAAEGTPHHRCAQEHHSDVAAVMRARAA